MTIFDGAPQHPRLRKRAGRPLRARLSSRPFVLMQSTALAAALTRQFESLIEAGLLKRLPLS
jgi:hypothetical protein